MSKVRSKASSVIFALFIMVVLSAFVSPSAFATIVDPEYTTPILDPALQPKWINAIPNALMAAFTYTPYAAGTEPAGFPPGVCGVTEDCYTISVREFLQPLGLVSETSSTTPLLTRAWGYGSSSNAPSVGPFVGGVWHAPAPTFRTTSGRPVRVTWVNELPNTAPPGLDPTYDCGPNAPNCYPYNRIVTHVHGAHVTDDSDGNPLNWYTPGFVVTGPGYKASFWGPPGTFRYPNDQEAGTIWYHDHAMGTTHNNTHMGMAGFFPVTDNNEKCLQGIGGGCTKVLPTDPYEIGFALQDRTFWPDGSFAMPDQPVRNLLDPNGTCPVDPATCPIVPFSKAPDGHFIPYDAAIVDPLLRGPFGAPNGSLEYFGNMPMVNGVVYGNYDVEPRIYRMRLVGGTDSRTWIIRLVSRATGSIIPVWQIGSEQGFLNNPVQRDAFDLMPGERLDMLVDLRGLTPGEKVVMQNIGPDSPYAGFYDPLAESTVIPEIMEFNVIALNGAVTDVPAPTALLNLRPVIGPIVPLPAPTAPVRNVSLIELTDSLGRVLPTIDSRGYMPMGVPVTELIRLNDVEEWHIINTTADAHPMHLHLVAFQVINRQLFDPASFVPPVTDPMTGTFTQPLYSNLTGSAPEPPAAWEAGWKDTIDCPPGYVTRVKAKFDMPGLYVWHCHILSHEEHDMMRSFVVTAETEEVSITAPSNIQPIGGPPVTFTAHAKVEINEVEYPSNGFEYRFSVYNDSLNTLTVMRDWGAVPADPLAMLPTWTWTPPVVAGTYLIKVDARQAGSTNDLGEVSATMTYTLTANPALGLGAKMGVYASGTWYLDMNSNGTWDGTATDSLVAFGGGIANAQPVTGNWSGTGASKVGIYADGSWYLDMNGDGVWNGAPTDGLLAFGGMPGAVAVTGDWTGTGTTKIGLYVDGTWYLDLNGNGAWDGPSIDRQYTFGAGIAGAVPVTGNWDGTGIAKIGIYQDGAWYLDWNGNGVWDGPSIDKLYTFGAGIAGAVPVTGDWNGGGTTKIGVYADGLWYVDLDGNGIWSGTPSDAQYYYGGGLAGVVPVTGRW